MQTKTWSLDSLPDSVGYESSSRGTPNITPSTSPQHNRVYKNAFREVATVDVGVQAGVSETMYARNLRMLQGEIDEREKLLDEAGEMYKRQQWNIDCLKNGLRREREDTRMVMQKIVTKVDTIENLLWALREETSEIVKEKGIEAAESLRHIVELKDEARLNTWLQSATFSLKGDERLIEDISAEPSSPLSPRPSDVPPRPQPLEATCQCSLM